jgi:hypothetical protein
VGADMNQINFELRNLITALARSVGNKVYLRDLESLFAKIEKLEPEEIQALRYLARDLEQLKLDSDRNSAKKYF